MRAEGSEAAAASLSVGSGPADRGGRVGSGRGEGEETPPSRCQAPGVGGATACGSHRARVRMPRKKKHAESPDFQDLGGEEEEPRGLVDAKKKRSFVDAFIVISDSDGEQESKEENGLQKKRTKQQLDRVKFAAKRKIAQMTEDEQFALALKMSEQEARQVNCREEEEEELVRKAIAESLNSYQPSDSPAVTSAPPPAQATCEPVQSRPAERGEAEIHGAVPPCPDSPHSEGSSHSWSTKADGNGQTDVAKSPLVVLTRLSQEIVESSLLSSIIVSPGKSQPLTKSNEKPSSPARSHSRDTLPSPSGESLISLSPIFGRVTPGAWQLTPRRLFSGSCSTSKAMGGDQDKQPLASTGSSAGEPTAGSSAVLRKGRPLEPGGIPRKSCGAGGPECAPQRGHRGRGSVCAEHVKQNKVPDNAPELCTLSMADEKCKQEDARDTVHYYWGIPFCPKGVDPNQYTQVILCQLEVYQKSLKQAQRQLLQKKEFGDPVVPCSSPLSQNEHGKGERMGNRANGVPDATDDGRKEPESAAWLLATQSREPEQNPEQNLEEEKNSASEDEPTTSYCQGPTCARDQTPAKASQALFAEDMPEDGEPMQITQSISALTPFGSKRSPDIATESPAEEEITVCPETQPNPSEAIEPEREELRSASKDAPLQVRESLKGTSQRSVPATDHVYASRRSSSAAPGPWPDCSDRGCSVGVGTPPPGAILAKSLELPSISPAVSRPELRPAKLQHSGGQFSPPRALSYVDFHLSVDQAPGRSQTGNPHAPPANSSGFPKSGGGCIPLTVGP
ncbi:hypothetical protein KIL84_016285 [Mauremys mutica]|uniref:BRCA1-A complex subunit RAP80 n=1 Tax=Mauremys mutica TaxID=74926 RepID=A0A9D4AQE5_9SAUR|nr:hypothetical protein KIL84_016285 [Mauremys mutica]